MAKLTLAAKIERLTEFAGARDALGRSLLDAYAACLGIEECCEAVLVTLEAKPAVRRRRHAPRRGRASGRRRGMMARPQDGTGQNTCPS
jgi:hypothetical protein